MTVNNIRTTLQESKLIHLTIPNSCDSERQLWDHSNDRAEPVREKMFRKMKERAYIQNR